MKEGFGENTSKKSTKSSKLTYAKLIEKAYLAQKSNNVSKAEVIYQELFRSMCWLCRHV